MISIAIPLGDAAVRSPRGLAVLGRPRTPGGSETCANSAVLRFVRDDASVRTLDDGRWAAVIFRPLPVQIPGVHRDQADNGGLHVRRGRSTDATSPRRSMAPSSTCRLRRWVGSDSSSTRRWPDSVATALSAAGGPAAGGHLRSCEQRQYGSPREQRTESSDASSHRSGRPSLA